MRGSNKKLSDYWTEAEKEWNREVERFINGYGKVEFPVFGGSIHNFWKI